MTYEDIDVPYSDNTYTIVVFNVIFAFIFIIGLGLQIRIIQVSIKEKDITWRIDVFHSIVMIVFYCFRIVFENLTFFVPSLHLYTGKWGCYALYFVYMFGAISIASHSFVVSSYKYLYIVHDNLIRIIGTEESSIRWFWVSLICPTVLAISFTARPTYVTYSSVYKCMGYDTETSAENNIPFFERIKIFFFCRFLEHNEEESLSAFEYFMSIIDVLGCFVTSSIVFCVLLNVMEAFFYYKIFSFMRRLV